LKIRTLYPKETELIKKAKTNDRAAQLMLYKQHSAKMLAVARYYIKDLQHAEDVLMTSFYKAFTRLDQFNNEVNFEGWIRKIIVNEALSFIRQNNKLIYTDTDEFFEKNEFYDMHLECGGDEIQLWIDLLPENQKIVFLLYAVEGYAHKEIAQILNIPVGTSKSYLSRARVKLQKKINESYLKKMKKHKIDSFIKKQLEAQTTPPSADLWKSISTQLDNDKVKKRNKKIGWSIAALFILTLGLGSFFKIQRKAPIQLQIDETVTYESKPIIDLENKPFVLEEKAVLPQTRNLVRPRGMTPLLLSHQSIIRFEVSPSASTINTRDLINNKADGNDWSSALEEHLLNLEIDSLMDLAFEQLRKNNTEEVRIKKQELELLHSLEDELNAEIFVKHKVLDILKKSYTKTDIALNEDLKSENK